MMTNHLLLACIEPIAVCEMLKKKPKKLFFDLQSSVSSIALVDKTEGRWREGKNRDGEGRTERKKGFLSGKGKEQGVAQRSGWRDGGGGEGDSLAEHGGNPVPV